MSDGTTQLRILHVINHDQRRGAERVAWTLAQELESDDTNNHIVAIGAAPGGSPPLGVQQLCADRELNLRGLLRRTRALRKLIEETSPDIVLAHGGQACLHSVLASRVPVVWHRILEFPELNVAQRGIWSFVARRSAAAIAITDRLERELADLGHRGPVLRVPNVRLRSAFQDLDHVTQRQQLIEELALDPHGPILGFVGHLVDQKDPLLALEVFERVGADLQNASFLFAGDGPLREPLRSAALRSALHSRIRLLGHRDDVPSILAGLDLLLMTSRSESMAGVSVEAALAGCPVVTTDFDGAAEVIGPRSGGAIARTRHAPEIAATVLTVVKSQHEARASAEDHALTNGQKFELERHLPTYRSFLASQAMPTPRVLHVMPEIGVGGAERALLVIARLHERTAMQMEVATLRPPRCDLADTVLPELLEMAIPVTDLGIPGRADRSATVLLRSAARLRKLCRSRKIDIVDSCLFEADIVCRLALVGLRTRHVVHLVSTPYAPGADDRSRPSRRWRRHLVRLVDKHTSWMTDQFIAITHAVMDAALRDIGLGKHRVSVIGRGVDLNEFVVQPLPESTDFRLLSVGRLVRQKAHDASIRAVALAAENGCDIWLTIHGEGPLREELATLIESLGVAGRVHLAGPVHDIQSAHRQHHAFLFPSRIEGQGNALLEAMACARPAIVSDLAVFEEVLGPLGRFARVDDVEDIARHIEAMSTSSRGSLLSEGTALRRRVEQHFDARARVHDLETAYREIAARERRRLRPL